jgi:hypothetical protein
MGCWRLSQHSLWSLSGPQPPGSPHHTQMLHPAVSWHTLQQPPAESCAHGGT